MKNKIIVQEQIITVMTRPIWKLMNELEMFKDCQKTDLKNAKYLEERVVNIPSSVRLPI
jgi:dTDP-4-amino-4,6-dideoxygalactose transaminase